MHAGAQPAQLGTTTISYNNNIISHLLITPKDNWVVSVLQTHASYVTFTNSWQINYCYDSLLLRKVIHTSKTSWYEYIYFVHEQ